MTEELNSQNKPTTTASSMMTTPPQPSINLKYGMLPKKSVIYQRLYPQKVYFDSADWVLNGGSQSQNEQPSLLNPAFSNAKVH
ncbi:hypothetical protein DLAC_03354 [Tieghemostelium lacteum]|uniref:Uncharacterized protein n=1 Tax=Tieghemostelium lacteum TaxID=361077 RepID=A0A152A1U5_TIELA|nr:hypothetical protein DLAC_03354 [Tieghemostelium lacteum]|eukprot:KYR00196.1 hypothetical protein DLAC_03354 [Tieghemostelium lacteum]